MSLKSWQPLLDEAYASLDEAYRIYLETDTHYFPHQTDYFNAFTTLAKKDVKYILFGQDPYPRVESAGGYAFIDTNVKTLFSPTGLSKEVNKATSLRNFIKMALVANGSLKGGDTSQPAISELDKTEMIESINDLRQNFEKNGVLLLNTALVFSDKKSSTKHIKAWRGFMHTLLTGLHAQSPTLILFGTHAKDLKKHLPLEGFDQILLEHPYNTTFITNPTAHKLFAKMRLLEK